MNSIYDYERRDAVAAKSRRARIARIARQLKTLTLVITVVLFVGALAWPALSAKPVAEKSDALVGGQRGDLESLCAQYRSDHLLTGEGMGAATVQMCGFKK